MQSRFYAAGRQDLWLLQKAAAARVVYALYSMHGVRVYGMPCTWCMHVRHALYMVYAVLGIGTMRTWTSLEIIFSK